MTYPPEPEVRRPGVAGNTGLEASDSAMGIKELIEYITRSLVDHPDDVTVHVIEGERTMVLELRVNPNDMGQIIGKNGRTAKAVRTLLNATATKCGIRAVLEIVE